MKRPIQLKSLLNESNSHNDLRQFFVLLKRQNWDFATSDNRGEKNGWDSYHKILKLKDELGKSDKAAEAKKIWNRFVPKSWNLKESVNEATHEDDNKEVIEFLVKNSKKLEGIPLTIFGHKKFKDVKSLVKELIKITKSGNVHLKIGLSDNDRRITTYTKNTRSEMEKFMNNGKVDAINIEHTNIPSMQKAIDKFGTSA